MKVRIVYCSMLNHREMPPGRIISIRTDTHIETVLLRGYGLPSAVWSSTMPGIAKTCRVSEPIDIEAVALVALYYNGSKTVDITTGKLCTTPDTPRKVLDDTLKLLQTSVQTLCDEMKITPDELRKAMSRRIS